MCYKSPGPRCSSHAKESLKRSLAVYKNAVTDDEKREAGDAVQEARKMYYETPAGLEYLSSTYGENSQVYQIFSETRERKIQAYKEAHTIQNRETVFGSKRNRTYNKKIADTLKAEGLWDKAQEQQAMLEKHMLDKKPLNSSELESHHNYVSAVTGVMVAKSMGTSHYHAKQTPAGPVWSKERTKLHDSIISDYMEKHKDVPSEGKLFVAGGVAGAGKTSTISKYATVDTEKYAVINPDDLKEELVRRNAVVHVPGTLGMESNSLCYEESVHLSNRLMMKMSEERKNVILDRTMSSAATTEDNINTFKNKGYRVNGMFVDIDVDTSVRRANSRYITATQTTILTGEGSGGRFVPTKVITNQRSSKTGVNTVNAEVFHSLTKKGVFDTTPRVFDNRGTEPIEMDIDGFLNNIEKS